MPADDVAPGTVLLGGVIDDPLGEPTPLGLVDMKVSNQACCSGVNSVAEVEELPPSVEAVPSCPADMLFPLRSGRIAQDIPSCTCCLLCQPVHEHLRGACVILSSPPI